MGTITPLLDSLSPQISGRAGDLARVAARPAQAPIAALRPIAPDLSPMRSQGQAEQAALKQSVAATSVAKTHPSAGSSAAGTGTPNPAGTPGAEPGPSASLSLSRGGDVLSRLLSVAAQRGLPSPATSAQPLSSNAGMLQPHNLAAALNAQVSDSGLFYESHLAAWVRGRYDLTRLTTEARMRQAAAGGQSDTPSTHSSPGDARSAAAGQTPLASLVQQQAHVLATGVFEWQGMLRPDTPMRWTIERETADGETGEPTGEAIVTRLALDLPGLGPVEARMRLQGDSLDVRAFAEQSSSHRLMVADVETLRRRLATIGMAGADIDFVRPASE